MTKEKTSKQLLQEHAQQIADDISNGVRLEYCRECNEDVRKDGPDICNNCGNFIESSGYDYLEDVLDTQYIADEDRNYLGARVLVAFGGPNIWINTQTKTIEAYWWEDKAFAYYENDEMGINDVLAERWEMAA